MSAQGTPSRERSRHTERYELTGADEAHRGEYRRKCEMELAAEEVRHRERLSLVRHVRVLDAGEHLEELRGHMARRADAGSAVIHLSRARTRERDEFLDAANRETGGITSAFGTSRAMLTLEIADRIERHLEYSTL